MVVVGREFSEGRVVQAQDGVTVDLKVVYLVFEPASPDAERQPLAGVGLELVPVHVLNLTKRAGDHDRQRQDLGSIAVSLV